MRDDIDTRFDASADEPPFPTKVTVAGIAWIVFGGLIVVNILILLVLLAATGSGVGPGDRDRASDAAGVFLCLSIVLGLFAAGFIFVGVQSVRGTAPGTIGNGVGSLVFGLLNLGPLVALLIRVSSPGRFPPGMQEYIQASISSFFAVALIVVGILALIAAPEYKLWRQFQKAKERWEWDRYYANRRRRRRREEPEEEDELPPRRRREEPEEEDDRPPRRRPEGDADRIQRPRRRKPDDE